MSDKTRNRRPWQVFTDTGARYFSSYERAMGYIESLGPKVGFNFNHWNGERWEAVDLSE